MRLCAICDREHWAKGLCRNHYRSLPENRAKGTARCAAWYAANREKHNATCRAWNAANKERMKVAKRVWRKANPELERAQVANYQARRDGAPGSHTGAEVAVLFEKQRGRCAVCTSKLDRDYHKDHVTALACGGSNWIENIQLLCPGCNCRKHTKDPIQFMQSRGFLL